MCLNFSKGIDVCCPGKRRLQGGMGSASVAALESGVYIYVAADGKTLRFVR